MSAMLKVDVEGRIPLPADVQDATGIHAGAGVTFHVVGPGHFEVFKRGEQREPARITHESSEGIEPDEVQDWKTLELPKMSLRELIETFGTCEPLGDWNTVIAEAETEQADELLRRIREGQE